MLKAVVDRPGMNISEIAEESDVSQPTVSRIVEEYTDQKILEVSKRGNMKQVELKKPDMVREIVKTFSGFDRYFEEAAERFSENIKQIGEVERCILFGSVARGTADPGSDIDVLVVVSEETDEVRKKIMLKAEKIEDEIGFHVSPTVMTVSVFEEHRAQESQFYRSIKDEMEVL